MYTSVLDAHASTVKLQTFGHEHVDTFRLAGEKTVLFSVPSLSTAYPRTNPTVRLWNFDSDSGLVTDYDQYYMDLAASNAAKRPLFHKSYTFSDVYNASDLSRASLENLIDTFKTHRNATSAYAKERRFFYSSTPVDIMPRCESWCQTVDLCDKEWACLLYTSPSPRDQRGSRMPSSA